MLNDSFLYAVFLLYSTFTAYFCINGLEGAFMLLPVYLYTYLYWFEDLKPMLVILCTEDEEYIETVIETIHQDFDGIEVWKPTTTKEKDND